MTENSDYYKMLKRMITSGAKRTANADEVDLHEFWLIKKHMDDMFKAAVQGQNDQGRSWAEIGDALSMSRQAAFKRWKR
jgi:hypothetical protein